MASVSLVRAGFAFGAPSAYRALYTLSRIVAEAAPWSAVLLEAMVAISLSGYFALWETFSVYGKSQEQLKNTN